MASTSITPTTATTVSAPVSCGAAGPTVFRRYPLVCSRCVGDANVSPPAPRRTSQLVGHGTCGWQGGATGRRGHGASFEQTPSQRARGRGAVRWPRLFLARRLGVQSLSIFGPTLVFQGLLRFSCSGRVFFLAHVGEQDDPSTARCHPSVSGR